MTAERPAEFGGEVEVYIDRILVLAQRRAAEVVADASHHAAHCVAQARIEAPTVWSERNDESRRVLTDVAETARTALDDSRSRVSQALASLERWQLARLGQLDRRLDEMVAAFVSGELAAAPGRIEAPSPVRAKPTPVERATAESAHFAQLQRLLDDNSLADPA